MYVFEILRRTQSERAYKETLVRYLNLLFGSSRRADLFRQVHMKIALSAVILCRGHVKSSANKMLISFQVWQVPSVPLMDPPLGGHAQVQALSGLHAVAQQTWRQVCTSR